MTKFILALGAFLFSLFSFSQTKLWSLQECIEYAFENNLTIRQNELSLKSTDLAKDAAMANLYPNLNLGGGYFWQFGQSIDPITNVRVAGNRQTSSYTLSSSWIVFDGMQNVKRIQQSRLDYMASVYNLDAIKNDISVNIASSYLQVLLNKQILEVAENQYAISKNQLIRNKKLFDAGSIAKGDYLLAQAQVASDEQSVVAAQNNVTINLLQLAQLLQLKDIEGFDILVPTLKDPDNALLNYTAKEIYDIAILNQAVIKSAELNVQSAEKTVGISKGGYSPTISVSGQINSNAAGDRQRTTSTMEEYGVIGSITPGGSDYVYTLQPYTFVTGSETYPFIDQFSDNINQFVGINLQIPIFNRFQTRNNVRNSQLQLESAMVDLEVRKNNLRQTIERAYTDALASLKSFRAAETSLAANEESWEYAQKRYEQGAMNQFDYERTRNQYLNAKAQQLQSKYEYIFKVKVLEFYLTNNTITL